MLGRPTYRHPPVYRWGKNGITAPMIDSADEPDEIAAVSWS